MVDKENRFAELTELRKTRHEWSFPTPHHIPNGLFSNWHRCTGRRSFFRFCFATLYINGRGIGDEYHQAQFYARM